MIEKIYNIELNLDNYIGKDLYSDGDIEDKLLEIVKEHSEEDFNRIIKESKSWPILYHLSHIRGNIVDWLPITKQDTVLEVGAGCGAITGTLAKKAKSVTCIDLSKKRSMINAYRNKNSDNITIHVGNFEDIEKKLHDKYNFITLIGVFEYGEKYINTKNPYVDFLKVMRNHLADDGKIIIAIENKYGLKYWAGCQEDHNGKFFEGIEGYPSTYGAKTFSRKELIQIVQDSGYIVKDFYYPYPDYKLPVMIYSDQFLPRIGELNLNIRNFDAERFLLFDEQKVYDGLIKNGMFQEFSNSYLVIIEKERT